MKFYSFILLFVFSLEAYATESDWFDHQGVVQTRIIVGSDEGDAEKTNRLLGWEAQLAPGWKTYWRSPGEAGLPVRVFNGDTEIEPLYPLPERFELFGLETYGYGKHVILPFYVEVAPVDGVTIKTDFMVCKDVCIPFTGTHTIEAQALHAPNSPHDIRLQSWLQRVPDRSGPTEANLEITKIRVMGVQGRQKLVIDIKADHDLAGADAMVEAGESFHFGKPEVHLQGDGTEARLVIGAMAARGAPDLQDQSVRITLTDGHGSSIDRILTLQNRN